MMCKFLFHYKEFDGDDRWWWQSVTACWGFLLFFTAVPGGEGGRATLHLFIWSGLMLMMLYSYFPLQISVLRQKPEHQRVLDKSWSCQINQVNKITRLNCQNWAKVDRKTNYSYRGVHPSKPTKYGQWNISLCNSSDFPINFLAS